MANIAIFRINYKSDFILTLNSDAGWMTPFCIKFWTGAPIQAYFVGFDGTTYTHCAPVDGEPTKLRVQFDDHHLPIGDMKFQIGYHFTVADFPTSVEDEVLNQASVIIEVDDAPAQVMLDFNGETAPEIEFSLPAYANEAQRIANEEERIEAEQQRIANEDVRIAAEATRQQNEQQRINQETARVSEFATLKSQSQAATRDANNAAVLANDKAQLAADKAALAQAAATLANEKAQLAADKAALANAASQLANEKAALAQQKAEYAQQQGGYAKDQGDYAKDQGDYAKAQGDIAKSDHERAETDHGIAADDHTKAGNDHTRAESDHGIAVDDHTQAGNDHTRAESDHGIAADDHTQAGNDHTRAESDHTRAESDHAAVEVYVDSLGAFDISAYNATGGVLAKYADLTAALGTNGANIPEAIRKGGMSVKFVLSSDNKYVQYRLMANTFNTTETDWQGVDEEPTADSDNLVKSGGVNERLNEVADVREKVNSIFSLLPNQLDSSFTQGEGYAYIDITSFNPGFNYIPFGVNGSKKLNSGVEYLFFAKIKIVTEEVLTFKVHISAGSATNVVEPTKTYNVGETISVYLGKATGNGSNTWFRAANVDTFRKLDGQISFTAQNAHAEYYGGYVVEKNQLSDIPESSYQGVAEALDYTNTTCTIIVDGKVTKLENRVNILEENTSDISTIREDVGLLNNNSKKIDSSFDISYDATDWATGTVDSENHFRYIDNSQTVALNINQRFATTLKGLLANKKYAVFAKIREELDEEDANNWTAIARCAGYQGGMSEQPEYTIKMNQDYCLYVGELTFSSNGWFIPIGIAQFKFNGENSGRTIDAKGIYYGGYVIDTDLIKGINRQHFAQLLDYSNSYTVFSNNAINAATSFFSSSSAEATHAENSDMSQETMKYRTPLYGKVMGIFGDSLVTYSTGSLSLIGKYLGMTSSLIGSGGNQVSNNLATGKGGFCTIEALAKIRKDTKLIIFWGGANDGNIFNSEPSRFGTIDDQPLGVADMFNYRVTNDNFPIRDTPGRTQTFYQAYKTLLRNLSILFPNTLLICCTQYRAFSYTWPDKSTVRLKTMWKELTQAEKECCAEYAVPVCDLFTTSGVNDRNAFTMLYDDQSSLIHPKGNLSERCSELMLNTILQYCDKVERVYPVVPSMYDKDFAELKEYLVDLRSESECNAMTLSEAITAFNAYTTEQGITLKNNMYMVFYKDQYYGSEGYFLIDKDNPTATASWEQYTQVVTYDMRSAINPSTHQPFGALTLQEAANAFKAKADLELWDLTFPTYYMCFYTDNNGNWQSYSLSNPSAPTSTSSWTFVSSGQDS